MKRKLLLTLISIIFIIIITPTNNAFANSYDYTSKKVIIDTPWSGNTLESAVKKAHSRVTDIITLNITAGVLTNDDVMWITKNLSNLEILSITGSATFDNNDLPDYAFNAKPYGNLTKLKNITIDLDDENPITFGNFAFSNCESLTNVNMPNIIEFGTNAFNECITLTGIDFPITEIFGYNSFNRCQLLTEVSLPNAISFGGSAFCYCKTLSEIDLPNAITLGHQPFSSCSMLSNISLPKATTFGNRAFSFCTNLTDISLPEAIEFGKDAFIKSEKLTTIDLPKAITFGDKNFYELKNLTSINLPEAITFGKCAFWGCTSLTDISLPKATTFGDFSLYHCKGLTDINLPQATTFGKCAFQGCDNVTSISLPKAAIFNDSAFVACNSLNSINLPEAISFGTYAFRESDALVDITLPKAKTFGNNAFCNCTALTDITLPEAISFESYAFKECTNLTNVSLPKVTSIGRTGFYKCLSLTNVTLSSIKYFGTYQFAYCPNPITMTLGSTPPVEIGEPYPGGTCKVFNNRSNYGPSKIIVPQSAVDTYELYSYGSGRWYSWVIDSLSNDATIYDLRINGKRVDDFESTKTLYNINSTKASTIEIVAFKSDTNSILTGDTGTQNLNYGNNKFTITVTAEDETTTKDYIINITRGYELSYSAGLGGSLSGATTQIVAPNGDGTQVTAVANPGYNFIKWSDNITETSRTDTDITSDITIEAEFIKISNDATLSDIKIDTETIDGFDNLITSYTLDITTASSIVIDATKNDNYSTVTGDIGSNALSYGSNMFTITVTAEDNTTKDYIINIIRGYELSYSAEIGGSITGATTQIVAPNGDGTQITAVPDNGYKFAKWNDNKTEASRTDTNVISNTAFTADFVKLNNDATLSDLKIDTETLNSFDPLTTTYTLDLTIASSIDIDVTKNNNYASISGDTGSQSLSYGPNSFTITVTAEDNTTKDYIINIIRGYELSYSAEIGGSITGATTQTVAPNGDGTQITAVPDNGYKFAKWNDNKTEASRTDTNITSNASIIAEFKIHHSSSNKHNTVKGNSGNDSFTAGTKKTVYNSSGKKETIITVKQNAIKEQIKKISDKDKISIPVESKEDILKTKFTVQSVKDMQEKNLILEVKTDDASYELPTNLIDVNTISNNIGNEINLSDIAFTVKISNTNDEMVKVVESSAEQGMFEIVVPPMDFEIEAIYKGKCCKINKFNSFVKRTIEIPSNVSANKITTAIITETDGSIRHVPTYITKIDGKYYATIHSLTNSTYTLIYNEVTFSDVSLDYWAKKDIEKMASRLVVEGKKDGTFTPKESITRAELAQILVKALGLKPVEIDKFADVKSKTECAGYIGTAFSYGIIKGTSETTFNPSGLVTRQDAMTMIYRTAKIINIDDEDFTIDMTGYIDYKDVSNYAKDAVMWNVNNGIIVGKTATTLVPLTNITRAELSTVTNRFLKSANLID